MSAVMITPDMAGCWIDGSFGDRAGDERIVALAVGHGMQADNPDADMAFDFLNSITKGCYFEWSAGDLILFREEEI